MVASDETFCACSVFTLANKQFSDYLAMLLNTGVITLHGPHQLAQKSTITGKSFFSI